MRSVRPLNPGESQSVEVLDQGGWTLQHSPLLQDLKMNLDEQRANSAKDPAHSSNNLDFVSLHVNLNYRRLPQCGKIVSAHNLVQSARALLGRELGRPS